MKRFLVVQHTHAEFLGALEKQFENRDIGFQYCRPVAGQPLPASALQYDALWLLGGAYPLAERARWPWLDDELKLIRAFARAGRPTVGLGCGGLLVALASGGILRPEPAQLAYWTTARATAAGAGDPVAQALDGRRVLVMANGRVDPPRGHAPLAVDEAGDWIALRDGPAYALLCRPEMKPGMIEDMIMEEERQLPEEIGAVLEQARAEWAATQRTTDLIVAALVSALDLMRERRKPPVFALRAVKGGG
jgi:GMP synthase-like glutamine amidotransferase